MIPACADKHRREGALDRWRRSPAAPHLAPFQLLYIPVSRVYLQEMRRHGRAQRTSQTVQAELIDLVQCSGVLEIVLDDIDVVGGGQKTCEFGSFGVPQGS